jgi:hypothetical protein
VFFAVIKLGKTENSRLKFQIDLDMESNLELGTWNTNFLRTFAPLIAMYDFGLS